MSVLVNALFDIWFDEWIDRLILSAGDRLGISFKLDNMDAHSQQQQQHADNTTEVPNDPGWVVLTGFFYTKWFGLVWFGSVLIGGTW